MKRSRDGYVCRIVITCGQPGEDGGMNVDMTYEGDSSLVSFLLEGARAQVESDEEADEPDSHLRVIGGVED